MAFRRVVALCLLLGWSHVNANSSQKPVLDGAGGADECHNACTAMVTALGETAVFYNTLPEGFRESYYCTRQGEVAPACDIQPSSSQGVSTAIQIINRHSCHFAVKSGGHAMFAGASNAAGGITIDLKYLNGVELSEDRETASIGPGNRWGEVYKKLEPSWDNPEDDAALQDVFTNFKDRSVAMAKERRLRHPWIYQNYENISQNVFAGYGEENRKKMKDIQLKYDPERLFAKLQPWYFKL